MTATASSLMSALSAVSVYFGLPAKKSIRAAQRLLATDSDSHTTTAKRYLALGYAYRFQGKWEKAIVAFEKARCFATEDRGPTGYVYAMSLWALADAHKYGVNFVKAEQFYWQAVKLFVHMDGIGGQDARACLADFREFAEGITRDRSLKHQISGILKLSAMLR